MEKDTTAAHRRHQLGPGAPPSAVSPGHLKAASGMAELQRSRCVGGLHQKGDPPSCIKTLCKELEPEGHGKDLRSDTEDAHCQASPEEQRQDAAGQVRGRWKEAEPEASGQEEPDGREGADKRALEAEVRPWSFHVHALPALEPQPRPAAAQGQQCSQDPVQERLSFPFPIRVQGWRGAGLGLHPGPLGSPPLPKTLLPLLTKLLPLGEAKVPGQRPGGRCT
uniref:Uncharacterized protein n=1 Tax=Monodon monoceros TaxID=40151 RepID=A0A8C6CH04_MONMO